MPCSQKGRLASVGSAEQNEFLDNNVAPPMPALTAYQVKSEGLWLNMRVPTPGNLYRWGPGEFNGLNRGAVGFSISLGCESFLLCAPNDAVGRPLDCFGSPLT